MSEQLISFLNSERLQQSRTIAKQLDLLGRQNRAIDQLRTSLKRSHTEDISKSLLLRLAAACERVERAGTCMTASELAGVFAMAVNHLAGDVRITHRRTRSLPARSPAVDSRQRSRSSGDEPEEGLDIELLYYSNDTRGSIEVQAGTPLSPLLSPCVAPVLPELISLAGIYSTPVSPFTSLILRDGVLSGKWGGQPITVSLTPAGLCAVFSQSAFKIPGCSVPEGIRWFGGQLWRRLSSDDILKGEWKTGTSRFALDSAGVGFLNGEKVHVSVDSGLVISRYGVMNLRGKVSDDGNLCWEDGQCWVRQ